MSLQDDLALREILEALTRLRLSHDRLQERRQEGSARPARRDPRPPVEHGAGSPGAPGGAARHPAGGEFPRGNPAAPGNGEAGNGEAGGSAEGHDCTRVQSPAAPGNGEAGNGAPGNGEASGDAPVDFAALPWIDEAGAEPRLEALVGAQVAKGVDAAGRQGEYLRRELAVETRLPHLAGLGEALREALPEAGRLAGLVSDADLLAEARAEELVFLDLETTGLHQGIIVLLGFMSLGPGERPLTVTQLFPRDYGEEAALLAEFLVHLRRHPILVTFNGRAFDAPFLESRLRFHGFLEPLRYAHVDLLQLARKVWRGRLPDFRLQTLERRLFGRRRLADLPGSEVPRVWEDYARHGELRHLPGIWEHNLRDLATLAELLIRAAREDVNAGAD